MVKKSTLIFCLLLLFSSLPSSSSADEKPAAKGSSGSCCKVGSPKVTEKKTEKPDVQCIGCGPKPCTATRTTWIQLYRKIIKIENKQNTKTQGKEQTQ